MGRPFSHHSRFSPRGPQQLQPSSRQLHLRQVVTPSRPSTIRRQGHRQAALLSLRWSPALSLRLISPSLWPTPPLLSRPSTTPPLSSRSPASTLSPTRSLWPAPTHRPTSPASSPRGQLR